jgi:hypothetical protein
MRFVDHVFPCLAAGVFIVPAVKLAVIITAAFVLSIPPAAKVLAIVAVVYPLLQALKRIPAFAPYLKGWVAIAINIALSALGLVLTVPAAQLYSTDTLTALVTAALAAAGIHGTVKGFSTQDPDPSPSSAPVPDPAASTQTKT